MSKAIKEFKAYFRDLSEDEKAYKIVMRKLRAFEKWFEDNAPSNVKGNYSFDGTLGDSCLRLFVRLNKDEQSTINICKWIPKIKKQRFVVEKFWREKEGYFSYRLQRTYKPYTDYIIFIEETANIDGCVITQKEVMQTIFVTDCENETVKL